MIVKESGTARLLRARAQMESGAIVTPGLVRPAIAESWRRCLAQGLDPRRPPQADRLTAAGLERARGQHEAVRGIALAEMPGLHRQLGNNAYILAFAAPDGVLLDTIIADGNRSEIESFGIAAGTLWGEAQCGTNALGTAIAAGQRIDVRGAEHFFADHNRLSCVTAPIFGPDRRLAGVLDASCAAAAYAPQARAVLTLAAAQIEASLFRRSRPGERILILHGRQEFLGTAYAGMLSLDAADRVTAANEQARFMLAGLPEPAGSPLAALFAPALGMRAGMSGTMQDRTGRVFFARIEGGPAETFAAPKAAVKADARQDAVAEDAAVRAALDIVGRAALRGLPVLIRGETGTGKEVVARFAHRASGRKGRFVAVNCAAIPPDLLAAELFGHAEGAYTGAKRGGAKGLAVEADGGTLFLDEIADLPAGVQAALLRFLDDFQVRQVGGTASRVVDTLLLAATNADLKDAVAAGRFRADLYYRLAITEISLPRLAARTDFSTLARFLLAEIAPGVLLGDNVIARLAAHDWPGNIRELRNVLTRLSLAGRIDEAAAAALLPQTRTGVPQTGSALKDAQMQQVAAAMRAAAGNVSAAARSLGVSRNTIYRALRGEMS